MDGFQPKDRGYYKWLAVLGDDSIFTQYDDEGNERSVEQLRSLQVKSFVLIPQFQGFSPIQFDVEGSVEWVKCWTRTFNVAEIVESGQILEAKQTEAPQIEKMGIRLNGGQWVYLYVYHTGAVRMTMESEP